MVQYEPLTSTQLIWPPLVVESIDTFLETHSPLDCGSTGLVGPNLIGVSQQVAPENVVAELCSFCLKLS